MFAIRPTLRSSPRDGWSSRRRLVVWPALALAATMLLAASAQGAEHLAAPEAAAIHKVIREQIDAFGRDDARGAFGYASPEIQRVFGTPEAFLRMVRDQYRPVYHAGEVTFGPLRRVDGRRVQTVRLVDESGRVWRALFTMRRQAKGAWKVAGCQLLETASLAT